MVLVQVLIATCVLQDGDELLMDYRFNPHRKSDWPPWYTGPYALNPEPETLNLDGTEPFNGRHPGSVQPLNCLIPQTVSTVQLNCLNCPTQRSHPSNWSNWGLSV